jgi:hypothetical protein
MRGTPKVLPEDARLALADFLEIDEQELRHTVAPRRQPRSGGALSISQQGLRHLRRHRRGQLRGLEPPYRQALENHVHRTEKMGARRLIIRAVGMRRAISASSSEALALAVVSLAAILAA